MVRAVQRSARRESRHPALIAAAESALERARQASRAVRHVKHDYHDRLAEHPTAWHPDPDARLAELDQQITATRDQLTRRGVALKSPRGDAIQDGPAAPVEYLSRLST